MWGAVRHLWPSSTPTWLLRASLPREGGREGNGNLLQYSHLENPMDGGAWWAIQSTRLQRVGHD